MSVLLFEAPSCSARDHHLAVTIFGIIISQLLCSNNEDSGHGKNRKAVSRSFECTIVTPLDCQEIDWIYADTARGMSIPNTLC